MYRVLNKFSEYIHFYKTKNITSYAFLLAFKIVKSLQCILTDICTLIVNENERNNHNLRNPSEFKMQTMKTVFRSFILFKF